MKLVSEPPPPGQPPRFPIAGILCMIGGGFLLYKAGLRIGILLLGLGFVWLVVALVIKLRSKTHVTS